MRTIRRTALVALFTAPALLLASPAHAATTIRDDDGGNEEHVDLDYVDDLAIKRLDIPLGTLSGATSATLSVYAQADSCGLTGDSQELTANGTPVVSFNPCAKWPSGGLAWVNFTVPLSVLVDGGTNSFQIAEIAGDWSDRNALYGVDQTNDYNRSDIVETSSRLAGAIPGELMWYLTINGGGGATDVLPPVSAFTTANGAVVTPGGAITGTVTDNMSGMGTEKLTFTPLSTQFATTSAAATLTSCNAAKTSCTWSGSAPFTPGVYIVNAQGTDAVGNAENPGPAITIIV